jgi:uracil-DNA glycosylase
VFVALGRIAYESIMRINSVQNKTMLFAHNAVHELPGGRWLVCSYHPSRQNTQTGRLTVGMFDRVWMTVRGLLER